MDTASDVDVSVEREIRGGRRGGFDRKCREVLYSTGRSVVIKQLAVKKKKSSPAVTVTINDTRCKKCEKQSAHRAASLSTWGKGK